MPKLATNTLPKPFATPLPVFPAFSSASGIMVLAETMSALKQIRLSLLTQPAVLGSEAASQPEKDVP